MPCILDQGEQILNFTKALKIFEVLGQLKKALLHYSISKWVGHAQRNQDNKSACTSRYSRIEKSSVSIKHCTGNKMLLHGQKYKVYTSLHKQTLPNEKWTYYTIHVCQYFKSPNGGISFCDTDSKKFTE